MLKVILCKGLPASGKTTWAKKLIKNNPIYKRVNKDDLRSMIDADVWSKKNEKMILKIRDDLILKFLEEGYNVIIDDTNIHHKHFQNISKLVKGKAEVEINDSFLNTTVDECIKRDSERINSVGLNVIYSMAKQLTDDLSSKNKKKYWKEKNIKEGMLIAKPSVYKKELPFCIIVDMDGTLAIHNGRSPYEFKRCIEDLPNDPVINTVIDYNYNSHNSKVFIVSGREDIAKEETKQWLEKYNVPYDGLFMRKEGDHRSDVIVKKEIYDAKFNGKYNIEYILDDRSKVCKQWRELGLTCFQVAEGDF